MNTQAYDEMQPRQGIPAGLVLQSLHDGGSDDDTDGPKAGRGIATNAGKVVIHVSDDSGQDDDGASGPKTDRNVPKDEPSLTDDAPDDDTGGPKTNRAVPADEE